MLRQAPRILARKNGPILRALPPRRLLTTAPPHQTSRSWKNSAVRCGLAIGLIYWYNTSNLFAEEAAFPVSQPVSPIEETTLPTVDDIARSRNKQNRNKPPSPPPSDPQRHDPEATSPPGLSETEEEATSEGAFNEETGEINWDCPCLGGMAHGPCGEQFKAAFSCFVHSKQEPKGMECIENFKNMQECFKSHPEVYADELDREEQDVQEELEERQREEGKEDGVAVAKEVAGSERLKEEAGSSESSNAGEKPETKVPEGKNATERAKAAKEQVEQDHGALSSESEAVVSKASHDER